ncbi:hypothetical protein LCGC14_1663370 [marine sediment metagenome]|uniref:Phage portal protein n=1 Tax=marine sediment metagenome TaxID=412755 RepID=A0A0F9HU63_9ZZZZ
MVSGWTADDQATTILNGITGWGKDSLDDINLNMDVMSGIAGGSYAEIVRNKKTGTLINLKPLNPGNMTNVINQQGMLTGFEQMAPIRKGGVIQNVMNVLFKRKVIQTFKPEEIFHLPNNRLGDEVHGRSDIEVLEKSITADNQSFDNMSKIQNFQAKPFILFKMKTDNEADIAAFKTKITAMRKTGDDMFIPDDENVLSWEVVTVNPSSILMEWRADIRSEIYRTIGLPQIIPGQSGGGTESDSKVIAKAYELMVKQKQLRYETQFFNQIGLKITLNTPSLMDDLLAKDEAKDGNGAFNVQPNEMQTEKGR